MLPLLVVWPEFPPAYGGMQTHGAAFATYLHREGVPFLLLTSTTPAAHAEEASKLDKELGFQPLRILPRTNFFAAHDLVKQVVKAMRPRAVFSSQLSYADACEGLPFICRTAGNDVHRPWAAPCDISFKAISPLPIAARLERLEVNRRWVSDSAKHCTMLVCNSRFTADLVASRFEVPTEVVTGGVDPDLFFPRDRIAARRYLGWPEDEFIVFAASRLVVKKALDVAVQAIALSNEKTVLKLAGTGPEYSMLVGLASELGVSARVSFLGRIAHPDLPIHFAAADVVVMPSRTAYDARRLSFDFETMGRTALEASASGIPVVASRAGGLPEVVHDEQNGLTVAENDPKALADAIRRLRKDRAAAVRMGERGRHLAIHDWSFDRVNRRFLDLLAGFVS